MVQSQETKSPYPMMRLEAIRKRPRRFEATQIKFEGHHVCIIACVYVQYVLSCSLNPFCRDRNILEYKVLILLVRLSPKLFMFASDMRCL